MDMTLCGMAKHQPALAAELKPVIELISTRPLKKKPAAAGGGVAITCSGGPPKAERLLRRATELGAGWRFGI
jgi:NAD(P)H-dependent FMN reductase